MYDMANNEFQRHEIIGRRWFESFVNQLKIKSIWQPTANTYDFVDGYLTQGNKKAVIEIKTRNPNYVKYSSHWMELDKFMNLTKNKIDSNCNIGWYVNFFGEDIMYIYDLKNINTNNCPLIRKWVPKATADPSKGYEWKQFLDIPTKYAIRFERVNNKWTRLN